jgi:hypothetical protein
MLSGRQSRRRSGASKLHPGGQVLPRGSRSLRYIRALTSALALLTMCYGLRIRRCEGPGICLGACRHSPCKTEKMGSTPDNAACGMPASLWQTSAGLQLGVVDLGLPGPLPVRGSRPRFQARRRAPVGVDHAESNEKVEKARQFQGGTGAGRARVEQLFTNSRCCRRSVFNVSVFGALCVPAIGLTAGLCAKLKGGKGGIMLQCNAASWRMAGWGGPQQQFDV